jgi:hypothetical protein
MDRQYIRDHQIIERYLRGTLAPDDERAFEEAYVGDPDLLDEIELVERLGEGIKDLGRSPIKRHSAGGAWLRPLASPQWAAAASVLLVVTLVLSGTLYRENENLRGLLAGSPTTTRLLPVITVRGDPESVLEAPCETDWAVLLVDPGFTAHDTYRAVVSRRSEQGSTEIWSAAGLTPDYQDQLALGMQGRLLTPGEYDIEITGRMRDWPPERASEPVTSNRVRIAAPENDCLVENVR